MQPRRTPRAPKYVGFRRKPTGGAAGAVRSIDRADPVQAPPLPPRATREQLAALAVGLRNRHTRDLATVGARLTYAEAIGLGARGLGWALNRLKLPFGFHDEWLTIGPEWST